MTSDNFTHDFFLAARHSSSLSDERDLWNSSLLSALSRLVPGQFVKQSKLELRIFSTSSTSLTTKTGLFKTKTPKTLQK